MGMECGLWDSMLSMWISHFIMVVIAAAVSAGFMWWFLTRSRKRDQLLYRPSDIWTDRR
jgi:hypothetical protein